MPGFVQSLSRPVRGVGCAGAIMLAMTLAGWSNASRGNDIAALDATLAPQTMPAGLVVTSLRTDGVAARAGLRVGDVIDAIDGQSTPSAADLLREAAPVALHVEARGDVGAHTLLLRHSEVASREDPDRRGR